MLATADTGFIEMRITKVVGFGPPLAEGSLGGHLRQVRIDRLVEGSYAATVEIEGPLGPQSVDARASDALNLAAITSAPVFVTRTWRPTATGAGRRTRPPAGC
jgi:hypothetical protein